MLNPNKVLTVVFWGWVMFTQDGFGNAQEPKASQVVPGGLGIYAPLILGPVLEEYLCIKDFKSRNAFAFRFANRVLIGNWWIRLVEEFDNPKLSGEEKKCIVHLASAMFTKQISLTQIKFIFLVKDDPVLTKSVLDIILDSQELKPNGSDQVWPDKGPFGNKYLREELAKLCASPNFSKKAAEVLSCYGSKGIDVVEKLVPILLLNDQSLVTAAANAILAIDADGVAAELEIKPNEPITVLQREKIETFIAVQKEKGQTPQDQLNLYIKDSTGIFKHDRPKAIAWSQKNRDTKWLDLAIAKDVSTEPESFSLQVLATVLYKKPDSRKQIIEVLSSEDRIAVRGMLRLLQMFWIYDPARPNIPVIRVYEEDLNFWPQHISTVLEKFPDLFEEVAQTLACYPGIEAKKQSRQLIPYLLTDDPNQTRQLREYLTAIDIETATTLGVVMTKEESTATMLRDESRVLTEEQRTKVLEFLQK